MSNKRLQNVNSVLSLIKNLVGRCLLLLLIVPAASAQDPQQQRKQPPNVWQQLGVEQSGLDLLSLNIDAWVLIEYNSGTVVASHRHEEKMPPASITKLMTNFLVYEAIKLGEVDIDDSVKISEQAWRAEGSRMFAKVNSEVELRQLLKSTAIQSGNDAAIALAEHVAGHEEVFVQRMNQMARDLDLQHSEFKNSTGLPAEGHRMSAIDIAKLSIAIIRDYPEYYRWYSMKEFRHNEITQFNRNKLLWRDETIDGIKTGHTEEAGYCLAASAIREGQRWIAVALGAPNEQQREDAVLQLLNFAFDNFDVDLFLDQQGGIGQAQVFHGEADQVLLQAENPVHLVVPKGRLTDVKIEQQLSPYYSAPIEIGQAMGVATLSLDGKTLADVPLVAMSTVKLASWHERIIDSVRLKWRELTD